MQALEWDRFLQLGRKEAKSDPAAQWLERFSDERHWASDIKTAQFWQKETQEATTLLSRAALWEPLSGLADPSQIFETLSHHGVVDVPALALLRRWLNAIDSWLQIPLEDIPSTKIQDAIAALWDPYEVLGWLNQVLTLQGEISENASPKLAKIFAEWRSVKKSIEERLGDLVRDFTKSQVLQDSFFDVRDGRYVLPVKISEQNAVEGIIYEASVSKKTVYVEPREIEILNNRLKRAENEKAEEIYRILVETSERLKPHSDSMQSSVAILVHWDSVQARARFGQRYSGKTIQVGEDRSFRLENSAHPLLWWSFPDAEIIRNTLEINSDVKAVLITGPNTGGKTVMLKALGFAAICARTGFPFPGSATPVVPFFDRVFADVGDPQSLELKLSSFSGHIMGMKRIIEEVTPRSLVLIDEMNTSTDPEEGAALSRAILEEIVDGALVFVTTHDPILKSFAFTQPWMVSMSMQFDEKNNRPLYRLVEGVPGRSHALETAERLGISSKILKRARSYLSAAHQQMDQALGAIETALERAQAEKREASRLAREAERLKDEWNQRVTESMGETIERVQKKFRQIVTEAQEEIRYIVRSLQEKKGPREVEKAKASINAVNTKLDQLVNQTLEQEAPEIAESMKIHTEAKTEISVKVGDYVKVPKWKSFGVVLDRVGNKLKIALRARGLSERSSMTVSVGPAEIETLSETELKGLNLGKVPKKKTQIENDTPYADSSIDLRGLRFDDAMLQLEVYLDRAFRYGHGEVRIIHGVGSGALLQGTRDRLKALPYVKVFQEAGPGEGGAGATRVVFERG